MSKSKNHRVIRTPEEREANRKRLQSVRAVRVINLMLRQARSIKGDSVITRHDRGGMCGAIANQTRYLLPDIGTRQYCDELSRELNSVDTVEGFTFGTYHDEGCYRVVVYRVKLELTANETKAE